MPVGLMSMQRIINYGSFLQAYGLYETIRKLGCSVEFIDYHSKVEAIELAKKRGSFSSFKGSIYDNRRFLSALLTSISQFFKSSFNCS